MCVCVCKDVEVEVDEMYETNKYYKKNEHYFFVYRYRGSSVNIVTKLRAG
jgi:hypothetical protein